MRPQSAPGGIPPFCRMRPVPAPGRKHTGLYDAQSPARLAASADFRTRSQSALELRRRSDFRVTALAGAREPPRSLPRFVEFPAIQGQTVRAFPQPTRAVILELRQAG